MLGNSSTEPRRRSVDNLQRIYTVTITLATTELLKKLFVVHDGQPELPAIGNWIKLAAFLATIIPFYHGSNRYLDATYVTGERKAIDSALMLDFLVLFSTGLAFFVATIYFHQPTYFYWIFAGIFFVDGFWTVLTKYTTTDINHMPGKMGFGHWAPLNFVAAGLIWFSFATALWTPAFKLSTVGVIIILRSILDYCWGWKFYFPPVQEDTSTITSVGSVSNASMPDHEKLETPAFERNRKITSDQVIAEQDNVQEGAVSNQVTAKQDYIQAKSDEVTLNVKS